MNEFSSLSPYTALLMGNGWRRDGRWIGIKQFSRIIETNRAHEIHGCIDAIDAHCRHGGYAMGFLAYEAAAAFPLPTHPSDAPLLWFGLCRETDMDIIPANQFPYPPAQETQVHVPDFDTPYPLYERNVNAIHEYIAEGQSYQVNYTFRSHVHLPGDPFHHFLRLYAAQPVPYAAYLRGGTQRILSFSPELFLRRQGDRIVSQPMKGTLKRGRTVAEDNQRKQRLQTCPKNQAENIMIVDMARNDLGRICKPGHVYTDRLCQIERYRTLFQMTSTVSGRLFPHTSLWDILAATFPAASITGAPKHRTMEIIRGLESTPRHVYCGAIGMIEPGNRFTFNVSIRTLHGSPPHYTLGIGGGIVWDSRPAAEYDEAKSKMHFVMASKPEFALFETLRLQPDGYLYLCDHLQRLEQSAMYWDFRFPLDTTQQRLLDYAKLLAGQSVAVRLQLSSNGDIAITHRALTTLRPPVYVTVCRQPVDSSDPWLYHKTTQRTFYNQQRERALKQGYGEVLFTNEQGNMTEGSITNLIARFGGRWFTPPVADGLLPGIWRARMIREHQVEEQSISFSALQEADEVWIGNSVMGSHLVNQIELAH